MIDGVMEAQESISQEEYFKDLEDLLMQGLLTDTKGGNE